ncbi:MAG: hypothetical protein U5M51_06480 [Emticicia sp.]|nr:hypothetical protein [Emticicia sp.]
MKKLEAVHSENELAEWEKVAEFLQEKRDFVQKFTKPAAINVSFEALAAEKSYKGISKEDWKIFREDMNIQESLGQLLIK